jgi:hypothetical protein
MIIFNHQINIFFLIHSMSVQLLLIKRDSLFNFIDISKYFRCFPNGVPPLDSEFKLPYSDVVGLDPSIDEMRKVVCVEKLRPNLPNHWSSDPLLREMSKVLQECWYESASSRLTALRIKKNLSTLNKTVNPVQNKNTLLKST